MIAPLPIIISSAGGLQASYSTQELVIKYLIGITVFLALNKLSDHIETLDLESGDVSTRWSTCPASPFPKIRNR